MDHTDALAHIPAVIRSYLDAHDRGDFEHAVASFGEGAIVTDEGATYEGKQAIREWIQKTSSQYTYTSVVTDVHTVDDQTIRVERRLEGDFPGGVANLTSEFHLQGDLISRLRNA